MKKSFLNLFAVVAVVSLSLVACNKTEKAVEAVNENTEEVANQVQEETSAQLDSLGQKVDSLGQQVQDATSTEEAAPAETK